MEVNDFTFERERPLPGIYPGYTNNLHWVGSLPFWGVQQHCFLSLSLSLSLSHTHIHTHTKQKMFDDVLLMRFWQTWMILCWMPCMVYRHFNMLSKSTMPYLHVLVFIHTTNVNSEAQILARTDVINLLWVILYKSSNEVKQPCVLMRNQNG